MNNPEISILFEDEKIFDLEGDGLDIFVEKTQKEFEQTSIGQALLKSGYKCDDWDVDDCQLQLFYHKRKR